MPDTRASAEAVGIDPDRIPEHIAIIMDGNGRWAREKGLERIDGHWEGYRSLMRTVYAADALGVKYLTVFGFSSENWQRPKEEVDGLMGLILFAMKAEIDELEENEIRVLFSGRIHELIPEIQEEFASDMKRTAHFNRMTFHLAINYGGRAEIVDSVRTLAKKVKSGELDPEKIDECDISNNLYFPHLPDPDLLIRTAGELRLSNFLLWETAYSEIYVTPTCWPDFGRDALIVAIQEYQKRIRKFGKVVE